MSTSALRPVVVIAILLTAATGVSAQGVTVRTWGYYDPMPYGPVMGSTYSYTPYRPLVTAFDPWGRAADMPLQPKVLYYSTPFWTPQGWYRPTSIAVMPNSRPAPIPALPPAGPAPAPQPGPIPPASAPTFRYDGGPANPVPDVTTEPPAAKSPIPTVPVVPRAVGPGLPRIPKVPELPDVPKIPGIDTGPKLGPAPKDIPPR